MIAATEIGSFEAAWQEAKDIKGWLSEDGAKLLYSAALAIPHDGRIVEIGSYRGRSTALLANSGREITAIDPLSVGTGQVDDYEINADDADALNAVVQRHANVDWLRCTAHEARLYQPIDLLYIDGDHQGDAPLRDFRRCQPLLKQGAMVAFHDFGDKRAVTEAVATLEREGTIDQREVVGLLYVGQVVNLPPWKYRVMMARPRYDRVDSKAYLSEKQAVTDHSGIQLHLLPAETSLLAHGFNDCVVACLRRRGYDFFAMVHDDISCQAGYISTMVELADMHEFDVLHRTIPIKNGTGLTSTAVAYSDNEWDTVRRLTMKELRTLPSVFDIHTIRQQIDPQASHLLPNTGCLLIREHVLRDFPGFEIRDRITRRGDDWESNCVPEDWNFGHWCHRNGFKVGGTKAFRIKHWGRWGFDGDGEWGVEMDLNWSRRSA